MLDSTVDSVADSKPSSRWLLLLEIALIFGVIAWHGAWPVPDVNEPHYLSKAKDFWNPDWIPQDAFLDSADAHLTFYWTCGWLTLLFPLPVVAWIGRLITWGLMAWAWRRLNAAMFRQNWWSVLTIALTLALVEQCQMAGEWIVGGFEAKGLAYVLVLFGLERLVAGRFTQACLLMGAASSFHVLVGGWSTLALAFAWLLSGEERTPLTKLWPGLVGGLLLSLPGILPAIALTLHTDPSTASVANHIYAIERLPHHLWFQKFPAQYVLRQLALWAVWLALWLWQPVDSGQARLGRFIWGAISIAVVGIVISFAFQDRPEIATSLVRYYWFRLSDIVVPLGVALWAGMALRTCAGGRRWGWTAGLATACLMLLVVHFGPLLAERTTTTLPRGDRSNKIANYDDWLDITAAAAERTPHGSRFLTPRMAQTFKWHAGRSETATWKDIPQDAAAIVAWWEALKEIHGKSKPGAGKQKWHGDLSERSPAALQRLGRKYQADFALALAEPPMSLPVVYQNGTYVIYDLRTGAHRSADANP